MNERIKHLAEQASQQSPDGYPVTIPYSKDFAKKFAELIVRECEQVSLKNSHRDDDMGAIIARQIKEHFGVER